MTRRLTPGRVVAGLIAISAVGVAGAWLTSVAIANVAGDRSAKLNHPIDRSLIDQGAYVAVLGDCAACHTAPGGKPFAGGLPIETPIGTVYTTNITPDRGTGIGKYSFGDFERAVRRGVRADGAALYPAMPYPSYARMTDSDTQALYAYFMKGAAPVREADRPAEIPWPLSMRWPLTYWRWLFAPAVGEPAPTAKDLQLARGAYLVEGPGHCGSCHTPRGLGLEERALTPQDGKAYLAGAVIDRYVASDLRGDALTGLGRWTEGEIVQFLQNGQNANTAAFGGMANVVAHSTQFMRREDLQAIAHYLKSLPGSADETAFSYAPAAASELASGAVSGRGALDYLNNCAACHRSSGNGYSETFPALAGNPVVNSADPSSLINIVLNGATTPATGNAPTQFAMPPFAQRLTDREAADLATFIRSSWGNKAAPINRSEVAKLRQATHASAAFGTR